MSPKVSVIVPVYKAERYLYRCVDSLLEQTFDDFEILLIDDGSPDGSGRICDDYALKDARVRVIHKENAGVSMARQTGIDNARGDFVIHADPDDWVEADMLESLYNHAISTKADVVICDFIYEFPNISKYCKQKPNSTNTQDLQCELFQQLHGSCCNKLVKRACYNNHDNVRFPNGVTFCEDLYFFISLLTHNVKVEYLPRAFYHYDRIINTNSIARSYTREDFENNVRTYALFESLTSGLKCNQFCKEIWSFHIVSRAFLGSYFDNQEFVKYCSKYKSDLFKCWATTNLWPILFKLSFSGYYKFANSLFWSLFKIRELIRKLGRK